MAEYYALLNKAVGGIDPNTADTRRTIYDKARHALIVQLKAINPPLTAAEISRQRLELEEAIRRVEREMGTDSSAARGADISRSTARAMEEALGASPEPIMRSRPRPRDDDDEWEDTPPPPPAPPRRIEKREPEPEDADDATWEAPREERQPRPRTPAAERILNTGARRQEPQRPVEDETRPKLRPAPLRKAEPLVDLEANEDDFDDRADIIAEPRVAGRTSWADADGDGLTDDIAGLDDDRKSRRAAKKAAAEAARAERAGRTPRRSERRRRSRWPSVIVGLLVLVVLGGIGAAVALNWDRFLDIIGSFDQSVATDQGPAVPVVPVGVEAPPVPVNEDVRVVGAPQEPANGGLPAAVGLLPEAAATAAAGRAVLFLEGQQEATDGTVAWRLATVDGLPVISATVAIPDNGLRMVMSIEPNVDDLLPISHAIAMLFTVPAGLGGGEITSVPRVALAETETSTAVPLAGSAAAFPPDFFRIVLPTSSEGANVDALQDLEWFNVPVIFGDGSRAIIMFEKGATGDAVFTEAIGAWSALP